MIVAVLLLQIDDELNLDAVIILDQAQPAESSDAYLYLLGIMVAESEDPLTVGKQLFTRIQQQEEKYDGAVEQQFTYDEDYPVEKRLPLPNGDLFCKPGDDITCWEQIFNNHQAIPLVLQENMTVLTRYQKFVSMADYHILTKPSINAPLPYYSYLAKGNRLVILNAIQFYQTGDVAIALNSLLVNISALRYQLKHANNLIEKIIYTGLASENIDAISLISQTSASMLSNEISPISLGERDFSVVMSHEIVMGYEMISNLDGLHNFFLSMEMHLAGG